MKAVIPINIIVSLLLVGCWSDNGPGNKTIRTDVSGLSYYIRIDGVPDSVKWLVSPVVDNSKGLVPGPTDYYLIAIVKYSRLDTLIYPGQSSIYGQSIFLKKDFILPRFPESVVQKFELDKSGQNLVVKGPVFNLTENMKIRFKQGFYFLTEDGTLFLYMDT